MNRFILLLGALAASASTALGATTAGLIAKDETWSGTVSLQGDVTVGTNVTLTILPGTTVRSDAGRDSQIGGANPNRIELIVAGSLHAVGTETSPIRFTSWPSSADASPRSGDWEGLRLLAGTNQTTTLRFCNLEFSTHGLTVEAALPEAIEHCAFRSNSVSGLVVARPLTLLDSRSEDNRIGIQVVNTTLVASQCAIAGNPEGGIVDLQYQSKLTATDCSVVSNSTGVVGFREVRFAGGECRFNGGGISVGTASTHSLDIENSEISDNRSIGCGAPILNVKGSRIRRNLSNGANGLTLTIEDSLIASNGGYGIFAGNNDPGHSGVLKMTRCRVEENANGCAGQNTVIISQSTVAANKGVGIYTLLNASVVDSVISRNAGVGLVIGESQSKLGVVQSPGVMRNTFENNRSGISIASKDPLVADLIGANCFLLNIDFQMRNDGTQGVKANGNYWGETTTAELEAGNRKLKEIRDYDDDASVGPVYIDNWLKACPCPDLPSLSVQPVGVTAPEGGPASFTVAATGTTLTYQWYHGGKAIAGATSPTLSFGSVTSADGGDYYAVVSTACGNVSSSSATLTVIQPPRLVLGPVLTPSPVPLGQTARLHVDATGTAPLTYRWTHDGAPVLDGGRVAGATGPDLVISSAQNGDAGNYTVTVSNRVGSVTSPAVVFTILFPPLITRAPTNTLVKSGSNAVFSVEANQGTPPFTYVWSLNGHPIAGETGPTLTVRNAQAAQLGAYTVTVANAAGQDDTLKRNLPAYLYLSDLKMYSGIVLAGPVGGRVRIDVAPRVAEPLVWQAWTNVILETSPQVVIDFDSADQPERYYLPHLSP